MCGSYTVSVSSYIKTKNLDDGGYPYIGFFFEATKHIPCVTSLTKGEAISDCSKNIREEIEEIFEDLGDAHGYTLTHVRPYCYNQVEVNLCGQNCSEWRGGNEEKEEDKPANSAIQGKLAGQLVVL